MSNDIFDLSDVGEFEDRCKDTLGDLYNIIRYISDGNTGYADRWHGECRDLLNYLDRHRSDSEREVSDDLRDDLEEYWENREQIWSLLRDCQIPQQMAYIVGARQFLNTTSDEYKEEAEDLANEYIEWARGLKTLASVLSAPLGGMTPWDVLSAISKGVLHQSIKKAMDEILEEQGFILKDRGFAVEVDATDLNVIRRKAQKTYAEIASDLQKYGNSYQMIGDRVQRQAFKLDEVLTRFRERMQEAFTNTILERECDQFIDHVSGIGDNIYRLEDRVQGEFRYRDHTNRWLSDCNRVVEQFEREHRAFEQLTEELRNSVFLRNIWHPCPVLDDEFDRWFENLVGEAEENFEDIEADARVILQDLNELSHIDEPREDGVSIVQHLIDQGFEVET